jgi:glycosyltransferase involved in cell wall biosynthesis
MLIDAEIVYVKDGSTDNTLTAMQRLRERDTRVAMLI